MAGQTQTQGELIDFGPKQLEYVPYGAINELRQVRTHYDKDAIAELATAIQSGEGNGIIDSDTFNLANPIISGLHSQRSARRFIQEHGEYYRIATKDRTDYQDLIPINADSAHILIAGHRRRRAVGHLLQQLNIDPGMARIAGNIYPDIEFGQAIGLQLRENVYERPSPQDEARAIDLSYRYQQEKHGVAPNVRLLAKELGFSETKVREALVFASMPMSIQQFSDEGVLSYSTVRQLRPLFDAFYALHASKTPEERYLAAETEVVTFCYQMVNKQLSGNVEQKRDKMIANRTAEIQGQAAYQQEELFFLEGADIYTRQRRSGREAGKTAMSLLRYRLSSGEVSDGEFDDLDELARLVEAAKQRRAEAKLSELDLGFGLAEAS
jgi:hypothetical protein